MDLVVYRNMTWMSLAWAFGVMSLAIFRFPSHLTIAFFLAVFTLSLKITRTQCTAPMATSERNTLGPDEGQSLIRSFGRSMSIGWLVSVHFVTIVWFYYSLLFLPNRHSLVQWPTAFVSTLIVGALPLVVLEFFYPPENLLDLGPVGKLINPIRTLVWSWSGLISGMVLVAYGLIFTGQMPAGGSTVVRLAFVTGKTIHFDLLDWVSTTAVVGLLGFGPPLLATLFLAKVRNRAEKSRLQRSIPSKRYSLATSCFGLWSKVVCSWMSFWLILSISGMVVLFLDPSLLPEIPSFLRFLQDPLVSVPFLGGLAVLPAALFTLVDETLHRKGQDRYFCSLADRPCEGFMVVSGIWTALIFLVYATSLTLTASPNEYLYTVLQPFSDRLGIVSMVAIVPLSVSVLLKSSVDQFVRKMRK